MLERRAIHATLWSALDVLLRQGLQFGVSVGLARLLAPEEFGILALLSLFTGIAASLVDSGFSIALVQAKDVSREDESTVFWFMCLGSTLFSTGLWLCAPAIARYFGHPVLVPLTGAMALNIVVSAMGSVPSALLTRRLAFKPQMQISLSSSAVSGALALLLAVRGFGVWALAAQACMASLVAAIGAWLAARWTPMLVFRRASMRKLFGFGGFMLGSSLLEVAYSRLYALVIGRLYGVKELGLFNRAESTKQLPLGMMASVVSRVALPVFSAAAHDPAQLRRGTRIAIRGTMLIVVPMMLGLAVVAGPVLSTLFGEQWLPATEPMQVLCLGGLFWPLHLINVNVIIAQGHSRLFFRLDLMKRALALALFTAGSWYGVMGIAWSQTLFSALGHVINAHYAKRSLGYGPGEQLADTAGILGVSVAALAPVYWLQSVWHPSPAVELVTLVCLGASLFLALAVVFRLGALHDAYHLARRARSPSSAEQAIAEP